MNFLGAVKRMREGKQLYRSSFPFDSTAFISENEYGQEEIHYFVQDEEVIFYAEDYLAEDWEMRD